MQDCTEDTNGAGSGTVVDISMRQREATARLLAAAFIDAGVSAHDVTWLLRRPESLVWWLAAEKAGVGEVDDETRRLAVEMVGAAA